MSGTKLSERRRDRTAADAPPARAADTCSSTSPAGTAPSTPPSGTPPSKPPAGTPPSKPPAGTPPSASPQGAGAAAIEALYRARAPVFVRFATATLGDAELARDVVQDAFAQALRSRERFRGEGSLEAWLWSVVVNTSRNAGRARSVRRRFALRAVRPRLRTPRLEDLGGEEALALTAGRLGEHGALRDAIASLPERQRMCIFLRYFADLDYDAIATSLGISAGTVGATLNAAHATLRRRLEEE